MADITNLFYTEEKDVEEVGNSTSDTMYAIALTDSSNGSVIVCTSVDICSDYAEAYQAALESGSEAQIDRALHELLLSCSTGFDTDNEVFDDEDTVSEWNEEIDESIEEEGELIEDDEFDDDVDADDEFVNEEFEESDGTYR